MDLSIVIPVFNESKKISADIKAAAAFVSKNSVTGEIIVVDDGSTDGTTQIAEKTRCSIPETIKLKVVRCDQNRGKGYAIRTGIEHTGGEFVMFADSGGCVPYDNVLQGLEWIKQGRCDIAHGSRKLPSSNIVIAQPWRRRVSSSLFKWLTKRWMGIGAELTDTQCGFKIYRGDVARKLYSNCICDGFMFDVEAILRAQQQGYHTSEFPIEWTCDPDSRLSLVRSPWAVLRELIAIKRALGREPRCSSGRHTG